MSDEQSNTKKRAARPDPEVLAKPKRRQFPAAYKLRIVEEAEACTELGAVGALLRREGLYSSHLSQWRQQQRSAALSALEPKKRGRKGKVQTPETKRIAELERQLAKAERDKRKLEMKLKRADLLLGIQKKVSELLGIPLEGLPSGEGSS